MTLHDIHTHTYAHVHTHVRMSSHEQTPKLMSVDAHRDDTKIYQHIKWFYFMETTKLQVVAERMKGGSGYCLDAPLAYIQAVRTLRTFVHGYTNTISQTQTPTHAMYELMPALSICQSFHPSTHPPLQPCMHACTDKYIETDWQDRHRHRHRHRETEP